MQMRRSPGAGQFFSAGPAPGICLLWPVVVPVSGTKADLRRSRPHLRHPCADLRQCLILIGSILAPSSPGMAFVVVSIGPKYRIL